MGRRLRSSLVAARAHSDRRVRQVQLEPRRLITLRSDARVERTDVEGAIVRVQPVPGAADAEVAGFVDRLRSLGVVAVKLLPRPPETSPVAPGETASAEAPTAATIRQTVEQMIEEARTADRDALRELVQEALGRSGL